MSRSWKYYINSQKYSDCQVVSAVNAYYYLTGKRIKYNSKEYEELVDLAMARHGSAIGIDKVYKKLGIKVIKTYDSIWFFIKKWPLPLTLTTWHLKYGFHSILVVDHCIKAECVRVTNFEKVPQIHDGWIFIDELCYYLNSVNNGKEIQLFGLVGKNYKKLPSNGVRLIRKGNSNVFIKKSLDKLG